MQNGGKESPVGRKIEAMRADAEAKKKDPYWHTLDGYSVGAEILRALEHAEQALAAARAAGDDSNDNWPTAEALARAKHRYSVEFEDPDGFGAGTFVDLMAAVGDGAYVERAQALRAELSAETPARGETTGGAPSGAAGRRPPARAETSPLDDALAMAGVAHDMAVLRYEESDPSWITAVANYGGLLFQAGQYGEALSTLERAAAAVRSHPPGDPSLTFGVLNNLATAQHATGDVRAAGTTLEELRDELAGSLTPETESRLCNNLGEIYASLERWPEAVGCLQRAVELRRSMQAEQPREYLISLNNLAGTLARTGELEPALALLDEVRSVATELGAAAGDVLVYAYSQIAVIERARNRRPEARRAAEQSVALATKLLGPEHPTTRAAAANLLALRPRSEIDEGDLEALRLELERCEKEARPLDAATTAVTLATMRGVSAEEAIGLYEKALRLRRKALGEDSSRTLEAAHGLGWAHLDGEDAESADRVASEALGWVGDDARHVQRAMLQLVQAFAALQRREHADFLKLARQTATTMMAAIATTPSEDDGESRSLPIAYLRAFAGRAIHHIVEKMSNDAEAVATAYLLTVLQKSLELDARRRRDSLRNAATAGELIEQVQARLGDDEILLECVHFPALAGDSARPSDPVETFRYAIFVVGRSRLELMLLEEDAPSIDRMIADYRAHVSSEPGFDKDVEDRAKGIMPRHLNVEIVVGEPPSPEEIYASMVASKAARVAQAVLAPALRTVAPGDATLSICPDGDLWRLSFEALPWDDGALVDRFRVRCLTSSWDLLLEEPQEPGGAPLVVAAPDFGPQASDGEYGELPGAEEEGRLVARLLDVELVTGAAATRERVLRHEDPHILHLATHSYFDDSQIHVPRELVQSFGVSTVTAPSRDSEATGLVLAGINPELDSDGGDPATSMVTIRDIHRWRLAGTRLVVLASCEGGIGELQPGDASRNLAQAFLAAGAANVVAALWPIDDLVTRRLMEHLYRRLRDGGKILDALREAKLAVREEHPEAMHWGAFYLLGPGGACYPAESA